MDFLTLISNAQKALDAIAAHDDFVRLLEIELWDDDALIDTKRANLPKSSRIFSNN